MRLLSVLTFAVPGPVSNRLALNPGLNLTRVSFSFVQNHFLRIIFSVRASSHQHVDKSN